MLFKIRQYNTHILDKIIFFKYTIRKLKAKETNTVSELLILIEMAA